MDKRIIYTTPEGGIAVIIPSANCGMTIEQIAAKDVPTGASFDIVEAADIPADRSFRGAWQKDGAKIGVDVTRAQDITKDRLRAERAPLLVDLDVEYMRATEQSDAAKQATIAAEKQRLRDVTKLVDGVTDLQELKSIKV